MYEQTKSAKRRFNDGYFQTRYFRGDGIDIGAGSDGLGSLMNSNVFPGIQSIRHWDVQDGDAKLMNGVVDDSFDFVHSSHSLEHMTDPFEALKNWIRITKPGGYIIVTVPDEVMYEKEVWPSMYNDDHKFSFTNKQPSKLPNSINVLTLCLAFNDRASIERIQYVDEFYDPFVRGDQTLSVSTECCIEFVMRKYL